MVSLLEQQSFFATGEIKRGGGIKGWSSVGRRDLLFQTEAGSNQGGSAPCPTMGDWHMGVMGHTTSMQLGPLCLMSSVCRSISWTVVVQVPQAGERQCGEEIDAHLD